MSTNYFLIEVDCIEEDHEFRGDDPTPGDYPCVVIETDVASDPVQDVMEKYKSLIKDPTLLHSIHHPLLLRVMQIEQGIGQMLLVKQKRREEIYKQQKALKIELEELRTSIISDMCHARKMVPYLEGLGKAT